MDDSAWEHVARWTEHRIKLPVGPLFGEAHAQLLLPIRARERFGMLDGLVETASALRNRDARLWRDAGKPVPAAMRPAMWSAR